MANAPLPFQDPTLSPEARAEDLLARLTLDEKIAQTLHEAPAIPRLGIPEYNWWNECLHGVSRAGIATVFPTAISMAATWNEPLHARVATVISDEARAKHHAAAAKGDRRIYRGLTYWTPNINIFRDPRWGRGHETYGECPHLTARFAVAFIRALQGDDPKHLKLVATPKHFAAHSGPEIVRHSFNSVVERRDLFETYLPAFRAAVIEGGAMSVMGAYNRLNGVPCCGDRFLLEDILRRRWGFKGFVVSDCGAVEDFDQHHGYTRTPEESAALAVKAGCDLNCGCAYQQLGGALAQGLLTEADIDTALRRLLVARVRLGMFDDPATVRWARIPYSVVDCPAHGELAREAARQSIVLLKNEGAVLPLRPGLRRIAVIGPNADNREVLLGNYHGLPSRYWTPLEGIRTLAPAGVHVEYQPGCEHFAVDHPLDKPDRWFAEAIIAAENADVVVLCLGLNALIEGEAGDASNSQAGGDKTDLQLPLIQRQLLEAIVDTGKPVVLVLISGSAVNPGAPLARIPALIQQFYPGQAGGLALAEVLFGHYSPAGRLPVTFYKDITELPAFEDYRMEGRTYRFFRGEPLFPFGFGLGYSRFVYTAIEAPRTVATDAGAVEVAATVTNAGDRAADEVVQLYIQLVTTAGRVPVRQLAGFARIHLAPGESRRVVLSIDRRHLARVDEEGRFHVEPARARVSVGGSQPDPVSLALGAPRWVEAEVIIEGPAVRLPD